MSFPKKGKFFPKESSHDGGNDEHSGVAFGIAIATALRGSLGETRAGVKTVVAWTGANEKTVKNWFSGKYGPSGVHLVALARHSDEVLGVMLTMAGRKEFIVAAKLAAAEQAIYDLLVAVRGLRGGGTF